MTNAGEYRYRPAWWLPGAHAQTIWGRFARRRAAIPTTVECLPTPDGDQLELHHLASPPSAPHVLILHGLEGSARSHYVAGLFSQARARGWGATLFLFRGCGAAANNAPRFYHSGETSDLDLVFASVSARWAGTPWFVVGVSLGGNVLLKWLGMQGGAVRPRITAGAAISVPYDLEAGARCISRGFARVYDRSFLRSLRRKALAKLQRYPALFERAALERARTVYEFDEAVTAPVHGFASAHDYYEQSSSIHSLAGIQVPTLLLSARDDPFLPSDVLEKVARLSAGNPALVTEFHARGGHVGFVAGPPRKPVYYAEARVFEFFDQAMEGASSRRYD
jgi:predicted alpha/beta-fold hydrolase